MDEPSKPTASNPVSAEDLLRLRVDQLEDALAALLTRVEALEQRSP